MNNINNRNKLNYPYSSKNLFNNIGHNFYLDTNDYSSYKIYEEKLKNFVDGIKENKIKYNALKILFEYEDNFKLVLDIYKKHSKTNLEYEILNFYLKSLGNFISLIHSDEPVSQLDKTLTTVNKYLKVKTYNKNAILFRTGDIGTTYYILLKGKAYTLVTRKYKKIMTFDEYKNHLNMLYIFGEDFLLEQTMHSNIKTCDMSYADIDTIDNRNIRNIYKKNYSCNYDKYMRIINGDEHIMIEDYIDIDYSDDENENNKINEINKNINLYDINNKNNQKKKRAKYHAVENFFKKHFVKENKNKINIEDSNNKQLESINELNEREDNQSNISEKENYYKKLREKLRSRRNRKKMDEKKYIDVNAFNIGIPKELLAKDHSFSPKKYDGGDLPTFFVKNRNSSEIDEKYISFFNNDIKDNKNKININPFNYFANQRRNFIISGYTIIGTILPGMSFGEISLLSKTHKRTSTIFIGEESQIGKLNTGEYNNTIKTVRTKIRTNSINYLLSTKLFGDISYNYFLNKYWIYFQCKKIQKGDFLFRIGEECESLYIIYSGEIKLNSYIDKDNIDELISGIKQENSNNVNINYYLNQIQYPNTKNNNNINNSSIFERKQKFCLMIGKKGDILGLNDIINYQSNKYICEGEVVTENLSYYEINKNIIFGDMPIISNNSNASLNNTFNIENIEYIIKAKEEFMLNRLNDIKNSIEQRAKYLKTEEENNIYDNKEMLKLKNKNKLNKLDENKNYKLNKHRKSLTLNSYNIDERDNKININYNEKQTISTSFFQFEKIKESINNFMQSQQTLYKRKLSDNNDRYLAINKMMYDNILNGNNINLKTESVPKDKNTIYLKLKKDINFKKTINNIHPNLSLDMNIIKDERNKIKTDYNYANSSISNKNRKINHIINNNDENDTNNNSIKLKNYNYCKPYEFPKIQNENNNENNWDSFRKIKILKFLFLNDNSQKYKQFKFYKVKKSNEKHNYFINTIRSSAIKNNNNDNVENEIYTNTDKYKARNTIHSDNFKANKNELKPIKLNIKTGKANYNKEKKNVINLIQNNCQKTSKKNSPLNRNNRINLISNNNSLNNKNAQTNFILEKNRNNSPFTNYKKDSLLKNFYFSTLNNKNNKSRDKFNNDLLPYIKK